MNFYLEKYYLLKSWELYFEMKPKLLRVMEIRKEMKEIRNKKWGGNDEGAESEEEMGMTEQGI